MSGWPARRVMASRYATYVAGEPTSPVTATMSRTIVRSGLAAPLANGVVHRVREAAIIRDADGMQLAARWQCGGGSVNATPAPADSEIRCTACASVGDLPVGPSAYQCLNADGEVIYVGSTVNLARRLMGHRSSTWWWSEVDSVKPIEFATEFEARRAERELIRTLSPLHNVDGKPAISSA